MHAASRLFSWNKELLDLGQVVSLHIKSWTSLLASFVLCSIYSYICASVSKTIQPLEFIRKTMGKNPGIQLKIPGGKIGTTAAAPAGPVLSLVTVGVIATTWYLAQF